MVKCCRIEEMIRNKEIEIDLITETDSVISDHLSSCEDCRTLVSDMRKVSEQVKSLPKISVSGNFNDSLWTRIRDKDLKKQEKTEIHNPFVKRAFYYVSGVAAVFIALLYVSSTGIFNSGNALPPVPVAEITKDAEVGGGSVIDSLENMNKSVIADEEMRLKVSTGE